MVCNRLPPPKTSRAAISDALNRTDLPIRRRAELVGLSVETFRSRAQRMGFKVPRHEKRKGTGARNLNWELVKLSDQYAEIMEMWETTGINDILRMQFTFVPVTIIRNRISIRSRENDD